MASDDLTMCPNCQRETHTILGKCANCWYVKNPSIVPSRRKYRQPMWDGDDMARVAVAVASWIPGLIAVGLGLILHARALVVIGPVLITIRVLGPLVYLNWPF